MICLRYGHAAGDAMLTVFSRVLCEIVRAKVNLFRFSSDKFVIFLSIPFIAEPCFVSSIVTQCFDRIHVSGLASRVDSEDESHANRNEQRQCDGPRSDTGLECVNDRRQKVR